MPFVEDASVATVDMGWLFDTPTDDVTVAVETVDAEIGALTAGVAGVLLTVLGAAAETAGGVFIATVPGNAGVLDIPATDTLVDIDVEASDCTETGDEETVDVVVRDGDLVTPTGLGDLHAGNGDVVVSCRGGGAREPDTLDTGVVATGVLTAGDFATLGNTAVDAVELDGLTVLDGITAVLFPGNLTGVETIPGALPLPVDIEPGDRKTGDGETVVFGLGLL